MNSTVAQSAQGPKNEYHHILAAINAVVLVSGTVSLSLMMHILKSSSTSITSIAVLNLIFTHFIFLITVPFRIYYYATSTWDLGVGWCRMISSMIHVHMYMSFLFYVIILITRLRAFYRKAEQLASFRSIHALLVSAAVWLVLLIVVPLTICLTYGQNVNVATNVTTNVMTDVTTNVTECFNFGKHIHNKAGVREINYIVSMLIIVVAAVLTALQANILRVLYGKHRRRCTSQQDFGAQLKSLCFALIMVVCFIPYHMFRLYYLEHIGWQNVNEVFLSLTTFNCLDMLTFLGKRPCYRCAS
ncbi:probable G-protein coupled receptor 141 [Hippoglossus stenolepis]|uniref:probable G-protein coupled receptor 141 n=1 Tax=Hippoglossus stenolepis TaxID=195615 RepID=UPI00159C58A5|nr:probable G-protein coupled receptor 141 [Hippoglossus stenolepis]